MDAIRDTNTLLGKCWVPLPLQDHEEDFNSELYRAAEMPSFNGQGVARGVARLFCILACGGELEGARLLSQALVEHAMTEAWYQTDALGLTCRMSNGGFMLRNSELTSYNQNPSSFGHLGLGGAIALWRPRRQTGLQLLR